MKISLFIPFMVGVHLFANTFSAYSFDEYDIPLGEGKQFTILTGDVLGDSNLEVVALDRVDNYQTHLQIFALKNDRWSKQIDATINPFVYVVDIANIGGQEKLVYFARKSLYYFDINSNSEIQLIDVNFRFQPDTTIAIPHKDIAQDLNGDGLTDFILPTVQGFWLHTQLSKGEFAEGILIGPPEPFRENNTFDDPRPYGEVGINALTTPWYLSRVHNFDANLDGRKDIVFWNTDHFDAYLQDENGLFTNDPTSFNTDVPFDTDGVYSIVFGYTNSNMFSLITGLKRSTTQTVLHSFQDLNNDGMADLITLTLSGRSVLKLKSKYDVYFGTAAETGLHFSSGRWSTVSPKGTAGGAESGGYSHQWFEDFNGDGQVDILRFDVRMSLSTIFRAFISHYVLFDIEAFGMEGDNYSEKPNFSHVLKLEFDVSGTDGGFFPSFLMGDLNGDAKTDFILGARRNNFDVYWGGDKTNLINLLPEVIEVEIPHIENRTWTHDFNHNGKDDILLYYEKLDYPRHLKVIISN